MPLLHPHLLVLAQVLFIALVFHYCSITFMPMPMLLLVVVVVVLVLVLVLVMIGVVPIIRACRR